MVSGPDLFVANAGAPTVVEVDVATGSLVRVDLRTSNTTYRLNPAGADGGGPGQICS